MDHVIETHGLTKAYGATTGISDLDLGVRRGEVFGFLGPNGAGKTTTIRLLLDLIHPTSGSARVLGLDSHSDGVAARRRIGYLPGELTLYEKLTGRQQLRFLAGVRGGVDWTFIDDLSRRLDCELERRAGDLSSGNKRKLGLLQALMGRPELLILDEPTSGLDPLVQQEFYALVREAQAAGQTVFLSSHVLPEVQRICDRVAFVRDGRLVAVEDVGELNGRAIREIEVVFAAPVTSAAFSGLPGVSDLTVEGTHLRMTVSGPLDAAVKRLAESEVVSLTCREPDLEDLFLKLYGDTGADA